MMPTRRAFVTSGLALLSAGCQTTQLGGDGDPNTWCRYEAIAGPFNPVNELPPDYSPTQRSLALRTVRQGTATTSYGPWPLKNDSFVAADGAFYRVLLADRRPANVSGLVLSVEWESGRQAPANASSYSFDDLPRADRLAMRSAVYGGLYRTQAHPEETLVHSESPVPYPDGVESSTLSACDGCWVSWDGRDYRVVAHGEATMEKSVFTYSASEFAANAREFRERIVDRYLVRLDELTPGERAILEEAIAGRYNERTEARLPEFHRLEDRLTSGPVPESGGRYFVEYEGTRYGLELNWACQGVRG